MQVPWRIIDGRYWRMLSIWWQKQPLASGSHLTGGRWNRIGLPALYLSADHATAIAEFHQSLPRPGTLAPYDLASDRIVDLTDAAIAGKLGADDALMATDWKTIFALEQRDPPTWPFADQLMEAGAHGVLVRSMMNRKGVNLVLWRWGAGGARVTAIDPHRDLGSS